MTYLLFIKRLDENPYPAGTKGQFSKKLPSKTLFSSPDQYPLPLEPVQGYRSGGDVFPFPA